MMFQKELENATFLEIQQTMAEIPGAGFRAWEGIGYGVIGNVFFHAAREDGRTHLRWLADQPGLPGKWHTWPNAQQAERSVLWHPQHWLTTMQESQRISWVGAPKTIVKEILFREALFDLGITPDRLRLFHLQSHRFALLGRKREGLTGLLALYKRQVPKLAARSDSYAFLQIKADLGVLRWHLPDVLLAHKSGYAFSWDDVPTLTKLLLVENTAKAAGKPVGDLRPEDFKKGLWTLDGISLEGLLAHYARSQDVAGEQEAWARLRQETEELPIPFTQGWVEIMRSAYTHWREIPFAVLRQTLTRVAYEKGKRFHRLADADLFNAKNFLNKSLSQLVKGFFRNPNSYKVSHVLTMLSGERSVESVHELIRTVKEGHPIAWAQLPGLVQLLIVENVAKAAGVPLTKLKPEHFEGPIWTLKGIRVDSLLHAYAAGAPGRDPAGGLAILLAEIRKVPVHYDTGWEAKLKARYVNWYEIPFLIQRTALGRVAQARRHSVRYWETPDFDSKENYLEKSLNGLLRSYGTAGQVFKERRERLVHVLMTPEPWTERYDDFSVVQRLHDQKEFYDESRLWHKHLTERLKAYHILDTDDAQDQEHLNILLQETAEGNRAARDALAGTYGRAVIQRALRFQRFSDLTFEDLMPIGYGGALRGVEIHRPMEGTQLRKAVFSWIEAAITRAQDEVWAEELGVSIALASKRIRYWDLMRRNGGREPTPEQIQKDMGLAPQSARMLADAMRGKPMLAGATQDTDDAMPEDKKTLRTPAFQEEGPTLEDLLQRALVDDQAGPLYEELNQHSGVRVKDWRIYLIFRGLVRHPDVPAKSTVKELMKTLHGEVRWTGNQAITRVESALRRNPELLKVLDQTLNTDLHHDYLLRSAYFQTLVEVSL